jgi:hypothetical protein
VQFAASTQREHDDVIECSDPADTVISGSVRLPVPVGV